MAAGLALGALISGLDEALDALALATVSVPIAIGPLLMFALAWRLLADHPELRTGLAAVRS